MDPPSSLFFKRIVIKPRDAVVTSETNLEDYRVKKGKKIEEKKK